MFEIVALIVLGVLCACVVFFAPNRPEIYQFEDGRYAVRYAGAYVDRNGRYFWTVDSCVHTNCVVDTLEEAEAIIARLAKARAEGAASEDYLRSRRRLK